MRSDPFRAQRQTWVNELSVAAGPSALVSSTPRALKNFSLTLNEQ